MPPTHPCFGVEREKRMRQGVIAYKREKGTALLLLTIERAFKGQLLLTEARFIM